MSVSTEVYVVALVGSSPGVLTELLWYLAVRERKTVVGCEIWVTEEGKRRLRDDENRLFRKLWDGLDATQRARLPVWDARTPAQNKPNVPLASRAFKVLIARDDADQDLVDVGSDRETRLFSRWAHQRFAHLATGSRRPIYASLAGGRKAMSAVLHSAFTLYARPEDRLLHVLLHATVETALRGKTDASGRPLMEQYACPRRDPLFDVPLEEQVSVFEVPFYPVAAFIADGARKSATALVATMRSELVALRSSSEGRDAWVTRDRGDLGCVHLGAGGVCAHRDYVLAWALLVHSGVPQDISALLGDAEALGASPTHRSGDSAERRFRQLVRGLEEKAGGDEIPRSLVPRRVRVDGVQTREWRVNPHRDADLSLILPADVLVTLWTDDDVEPRG